MNKNTEVIKFENIDVFYRKRQNILTDVSLTIHKNEFITVLGPNGSGKTTLIKTIHGISRYTGDIFLNGKKLRSCSKKSVAKAVSYVSQISDEYEGLTVLDYLRMARMPHFNLFNLNKSKDDKWIISLLEDFGLKGMAEKYMADLSGGQQQIISIIGGIVQDSDIILIDEPTNHLDPKVVLLVFDMLAKLKKQGKTIILISHSINRAISLADKVALIKDGKLMKFGTRKEVITKPNIDKLFGVDSKVSKGLVSSMETVK